MPATGLYFIPYSASAPPAYGTLQERLTRLAGTRSSNPTPQWSLMHHLFFDTSSLLPASTSAPNSAQQRRYLQFLALPQDRQGSMFVGSTPRPYNPQAPTQSNGADGTSKTTSGDGMSIISIPIPQVEDFFNTVQKKMEPLWAFRVAMRVEGGFGFDMGDWKIRVGEVRQTGGGSAQARVRGCVVEITLSPDNEEGMEIDDEDESKNAIFTGIWEQLGLEGGKAYIDVPGLMGSKDSFSLIRQYMEMLRFARNA